jgi:hypothetical protein
MRTKSTFEKHLGSIFLRPGFLDFSTPLWVFEMYQYFTADTKNIAVVLRSRIVTTQLFKDVCVQEFFGSAFFAIPMTFCRKTTAASLDALLRQFDNPWPSLRPISQIAVGATFAT